MRIHADQSIELTPGNIASHVYDDGSAYLELGAGAVYHSILIWLGRGDADLAEEARALRKPNSRPGWRAGPEAPGTTRAAPSPPTSTSGRATGHCTPIPAPVRAGQRTAKRIASSSSARRPRGTPAPTWLTTP
jgi:hypothetical protein